MSWCAPLSQCIFQQEHRSLTRNAIFPRSPHPTLLRYDQGTLHQNLKSKCSVSHSYIFQCAHIDFLQQHQTQSPQRRVNVPSSMQTLCSFKAVYRYLHLSSTEQHLSRQPRQTPTKMNHPGSIAHCTAARTRKSPSV